MISVIFWEDLFVGGRKHFFTNLCAPKILATRQRSQLDPGYEPC